MDLMKTYELGELLPYEQPSKYIVNSTEYSDRYPTPVLTAGKSFILGYTDETDNIFDELPVIIFDDFTTATQYVDFKFKVKSSAMKILHINTELVLPKYIYYLLQTIHIEHSTHKRYWIQQFSKVKVDIPSIPEQERVVSQIEESLSQLDSAVETLKKTKQQLEVYRDTVLKSAFTGSYPRKPLDEISKAISGYAFKSKLYDNSGRYRVVKIGNVKPFHFDFSRDNTRTNEFDEKIIEKYLLKQGDCIITLTGSRGKRDYGFVAMINDENDYMLNQRVAALRFDISVAYPKFFMYYLSSIDYRNKFFSYETGNVGQGNVGIKALIEPEVIVPSLQEQKRIVKRIESQLSVCDCIEQTVNQSLQQAEALRQSILKQAFEG